MQTGDGLLVRLNPRDGVLSQAQLLGVARAAARFGNGRLEISARGNLQIRGLSEASAPRFDEAVTALGIEPQNGVEVRTNALAGLDASEIADGRPLAQAIRDGIAGLGLTPRLGPKISVTVDGGRALPLSGLVADAKVWAVDASLWSLEVAGKVLGAGSVHEAATATVRTLEMVAERGRAAHGRDLGEAELVAIAAGLRSCAAPPRVEQAGPVGIFPLKNAAAAHGFAVALGRILADDLATFCAALPETARFHLAPGRGFLITGLDHAAELPALAARAGFVTDARDIRLRIAACTGAPGCASAWLDTAHLAALVVEDGSDLLSAVPALHLSGCAKGCARPAGVAVSVIGGESGPELAEVRDFLDLRGRERLKTLAEMAARRPKVPA